MVGCLGRGCGVISARLAIDGTTFVHLPKCGEVIQNILAGVCLPVGSVSGEVIRDYQPNHHHLEDYFFDIIPAGSMHTQSFESGADFFIICRQGNRLYKTFLTISDHNTHCQIFLPALSMQPKTPFPQFSSASCGRNFQQLQHFHIISIKVLEWQQQANPTAPPPVAEQPAPDEMEGSGTPLQVFQSTESRSLPYVTLEPFDQPGVAGMEDQVVAGSAYAEPVSDPKAEFYWQRPEGSDNGVSSAPALGLSAEAPEVLGGGKEDEVIEDRAEGPSMKEEFMEPEELDSLLGASNIEMEEGVMSEEVVQEGWEKWSL
ncbi:hypothetical protein O988_02951 [Pseudogymnoascus sp. VKM F-3808]|nr:hypothetical protein O988_02951 [Pseudogymnoascus sp. VKM F-3808]